MTYSLTCPAPCDHEIRVDAENDDEAVNKLLTAGAFRCRNAKYRCHCKMAPHNMSPVSEEELKRMVRVCMCEEQGKQEDYNGVLARLHV